jgi:DNA-binding transcriptional LysR family regulator
MSGPVRLADIAELRAFCAAADLGSLGRAARLIGVSQPALSKRLRTLEAVAGARLLERSPRGVTLTPAGTRLYVEARKLLAQAEEVESLMAGLRGEEQPVRLATSPTIAEYVLPGPLVEFEQKRERHLSVELVIANSLVVRELVREGRAEFGIAAVDAGGSGDGVLRELPFCEDSVVAAVPEGHPWEKLDAIPVEELVQTPMVMRDPSANTRRTIEAALEARGLVLAPPLAEVGSTSALKATAISENAPVLLSRLAVRGNGDGLVERPVEGIDFARQFVIVTGNHETLRPAARALIDHLVKTTG